MALKLKKKKVVEAPVKKSKKVKDEAPAKKSKKKSSSEDIYSHCFKCSEKVLLSESYVEELVSGRKVRHGVCSQCGGKTAAMVGKDVPADRVQSKKEAKAKAEEKKVKKAEKLSALNAKNTAKKKKAKVKK